MARLVGDATNVAIDLPPSQFDIGKKTIVKQKLHQEFVRELCKSCTV